MRNRIPLPPEDPNLARTLEWLREIAEAVQAVHVNPRHGCVLPERKPRNIEPSDWWPEDDGEAGG